MRKVLAYGLHLLSRLNPVTVAKETWSYAWTRFGPQGAAELSHAINHQSPAYVPYGPAQAPATPGKTMGNALSIQAPTPTPKAKGKGLHP